MTNFLPMGNSNQSTQMIFLLAPMEHHMPPSIKKSCVMHCGRNQSNYAYTLSGLLVASVDKIVDLGDIRSSNTSYRYQCQVVAAKAIRIANVIRRTFNTGGQSCYGLHFNYMLVRCLCNVCHCGHLMHSITSQY